MLVPQSFSLKPGLCLASRLGCVGVLVGQYRAGCWSRNKTQVVCGCEHKCTTIAPIMFGNALHTTLTKRVMHSCWEIGM